MVLSEVLTELRRQGLNASESQVRWAIKSGKIDRPTLDGALRFVFKDEHVAQLATYLESKHAVA